MCKIFVYIAKFEVGMAYIHILVLIYTVFAGY